MRTTYDIEMMRQVGFCSGIENYSRHIDGREAGSPPHCLLDYFPDDFLTVIDESHATVPQIGGMYEGDASRKRTLVEHGFRLPSAQDNRPLRFDEFEERVGQTVYLSATPGPWELGQTQGEFVEQVIRPTGLIDPEVVVKPTKGQIDDLMHEINQRAERDERVLVTTLTKKMAEDLTDYLLEHGIRVRYLHSEVDTLRRVELLRELRRGEFDVLVGINLLREGLDLPEVSLVAILDADKEGFLRSGTSLIQTIGRAARNVSGQVHMYADKMTPSMAIAIDETNRRRDKQVAYNTANGIDPQPLRKKLGDILDDIYREAEDTAGAVAATAPAAPSRRRRPADEPRQVPVREHPQPGKGRRHQGRPRRRHPGPRGHGPGRARHPHPGPQRPDARRRPRAAVRARRPHPRRGLRTEEGAPRHGRRRRQVTAGDHKAHEHGKAPQPRPAAGPFFCCASRQLLPPASFSRRAARASSVARVPAGSSGARAAVGVDEVTGPLLVEPPAAAAAAGSAASAWRAVCTCLVWASQRWRASAYCCSHASRCFSKPDIHSAVSGSKPSG